MSLDVRSPTGQMFTIDGNTVYDDKGADIGYINPTAGTYVNRADGGSIPLEELERRGFVFPDGYIAQLAGTSTFDGVSAGPPPTGLLVLLPSGDAPGDGTNTAPAAATSADSTHFGSTTVPLVAPSPDLPLAAAEVIKALTDPRFQAANPAHAADTVGALETFVEMWSVDPARLAPTIEQWIEIAQRVLREGTWLPEEGGQAPEAPTRSLGTFVAPAPSASVVRTSLQALGAINAASQPLNMRQVYDFAWAYGVSGNAMDNVLSWPPGTLDAWVSKNRFVPIMTMHDTTVVPLDWRPPPLFAFEVHGPSSRMPEGVLPAIIAAPGSEAERMLSTIHAYGLDLHRNFSSVWQSLPMMGLRPTDLNRAFGWAPGTIEEYARYLQEHGLGDAEAPSVDLPQTIHSGSGG